MNGNPIHQRLEQIDTFEKENREAKLMLKEALEEDATYLEVIEEIREAIAKRKKIKGEILAKTENQKIQSHIKENNEELTTLKEILSTELVEVYQKEKTDEIEDQFGEKRKFKIVAKLLPRKKRYDERDGEGKFAKDGEMIPEGTIMRELPEIKSDESSATNQSE